MNRLQIISLASILLLSSCQQKPQRIGMPKNFSATIPDTITIVSYNVENLFDMADNGDEYPEYKPNHNNWTNNTYQIKCANIASVLAQINADIAVLVEVENENALSGLLSALAERKCPYPYYALGGARTGSVMPVVLSKFPVLSEKTFGVAAGASEHNRNMLEAAVYLGSDTLTVFACHWPSKTHKESGRLANAKLLAERLASLPKGSDYVVAGDFNEDYDECETFSTTGLDDTKGVTGLNHILGTVSSAPGKFVVYRRKSDVASDTGVALFDPWLELPEARRLTTVYKGRPETPDHILLAASMFDTTGISYVDNSFAPFTWNGRLTKDGAPFRWQMRFTKSGPIHIGEGFSDHLPVAAKLCRKPYRLPDGPSGGGLDTPEPRGAPGSFEDGVDGWVSCIKHVSVARDSVAPHSGGHCLTITGIASSNASAARCRLSTSGACANDSRVLSLWLRGSGSLCFRVKGASEKKWTYFKGEDFSPAKAGKYTDYVFDKWTNVLLLLESVPGSEKEIDVELRTKKDKDVKIFIDDVKIVCNKQL
jgi:Endonuclease/Exonuclease/phosphatase family